MFFCIWLYMGLYMVCILGAVLVELVSISIESLCLHSFFENFFIYCLLLASYWLLIGFLLVSIQLYIIFNSLLYSLFFFFFFLYFFFFEVDFFVIPL